MASMGALVALGAFNLAFGGSALSNAIQVVRDSYNGGNQPVAVFDLDETLIDSHPRKLLAWKEAISGLGSRYPEAVSKAEPLTLQTIESLSNRYDYRELFAKLGITDADFMTEADRRMTPIYLSGKYMDFDREVPCAAAFIRELLSARAQVAYVSSRFSSTQEASTRRSLERLGFARPGDHTQLVLRPDGMGSIEFKRWAFAKVAHQAPIEGRPSEVVIVGENEPENMNAMIEMFPDALSFFVLSAAFKAEPLKDHPTLLHDFCQ